MSFFNPGDGTRSLVTFYAQLIQSAAIVIGGGWAIWSYGRQLEAPYDEKQLNLYIEAAKVAADLAKIPEGADRKQIELRFWELYWGELAFVESRAQDKGKSSIETRMVSLCEATFGVSACHASPETLASCAIYLSHSASDEIQEHWKPWRGLFNWASQDPRALESCPPPASSAASRSESTPH